MTREQKRINKKTRKTTKSVLGKIINGNVDITEIQDLLQDVRVPYQNKKANKDPIEAKTENQAYYIQSILSNNITIGIGPAGTGKTFVATAIAAEMLDRGEISQIIITRPAVECGEKLGFLPGELEDKFDPYLEPVRDVLNEKLGKTFVDYLIEHDRIVAKPIAYMRGKSFKDCVVICDEAENLTVQQFKMFISRIGYNTKYIINGDVRQSDIRGENGLADAIQRLDGIKGLQIVEFTYDDIVRHGMIKEILKRYDKTYYFKE